MRSEQENIELRAAGLARAGMDPATDPPELWAAPLDVFAEGLMSAFEPMPMLVLEDWAASTKARLFA